MALNVLYTLLSVQLKKNPTISLYSSAYVLNFKM